MALQQDAFLCISSQMQTEHTVQCALCFNRSKANFLWQADPLLPKQPRGYIYSRDMQSAGETVGVEVAQ